MSERQNQTATAVQATTTSACSHPEAAGTRWGDPISEERQRLLLDRLAAWDAEPDHGNRRGPFDASGLSDREIEEKHLRLTGADVFFLAAHTLVAMRDDCPDLASAQTIVRTWRDADFELVLSLTLSGLHLDGANVDQAH